METTLPHTIQARNDSTGSTSPSTEGWSGLGAPRERNQEERFCDRGCVCEFAFAKQVDYNMNDMAAISQHRPIYNDFGGHKTALNTQGILLWSGIQASENRRVILARQPGFPQTAEWVIQLNYSILKGTHSRSITVYILQIRVKAHNAYPSTSEYRIHNYVICNHVTISQANCKSQMKKSDDKMTLN